MNLLKLLFGKASDLPADRFCATTHIGDRDENQDFHAHAIDQNGALLIVADGLGGHDDGALASRYLCEALLACLPDYVEQLRQAPSTAINQLFSAAITLMRDRLNRVVSNHDAHTTIAIAWVSLPDYQVTSLHVGDSRVYCFNKRNLHWRTRDHSVVQMLVDMGDLDEAEMGSHPEQNALTRSVNMKDEIKTTVNSHNALNKGDALLLCSDGFWEEVPEKEYRSLAGSRDADKMLNKLVNRAVERAGIGGDNVTAMFFQRR